MDRVSHAMRIVGSAIGGKYEVRRVLGIGGMGAVYEAKHAYTGRRVAVKVLGPDFASSHEAVERFLQEAQAPSSIGHPNIVEVLDAGEDPDVGLYVVLEYLDGEDLESAVERGSIGLPALLSVMLQTLEALGAAHARGFVHRDIKPANIFLTKNRDGSLRAKLLDFGIAKNTARGLTVGNAVMGTPHYMAPEQAQGLSVDARADLWAVGAVLYHALAGVPPYDGDNPNVIMVSIIMNEPPSLRTVRPDLSKSLLDVVDRALVKSLDARWPDAQRMHDRLAASPELHGGVVKITSTMRNRAGALSGMRASAPSDELPRLGLAQPPSASLIARSNTGTLGPESFAPPRGTGTLGPDDVDQRPSTQSPVTLSRASVPVNSVVPDARSIVPSTPLHAPSVAPAPVAVAPTKGRSALIVALAASVVVAAVAVAALALRSDRPATPATRPVTTPAVTSPSPDAQPSANTHAAVALPDAAAPTIAATPDAAAPTIAAILDASAPEEPRARRGRHGRHAPRGDTATTTAAPAPSPTTTPPTTTRIGGLHIGSYNTP